MRQEISDRLPTRFPIGVSQNQPAVAETVAWLKEECGLDDSGAEQAIEYILQGRAVLGAVPTQDTIIAERFFDEGGGMQLIIHAPFGGRINKAWGLALRKRFCRGFNFELQAAATDNGLNIALAEQHSFPLADVFHFLQRRNRAADSGTGRARLAHLRHALALGCQSRAGPAAFSGRQESSAADSAHALRRSAGLGVSRCGRLPGKHRRRHPDSRSSAGARSHEGCAHRGDGYRRPEELLRGIEDGRIRCLAVDTPVPSQFSHEILNANPYAYLDDAPLEERRARAVEMRRMLPESVLEEVGKLDPAAIAQVREEAWPDVRDADELHDVLHTLIALPEHVGTAARLVEVRGCSTRRRLTSSPS